MTGLKPGQEELKRIIMLKHSAQNIPTLGGSTHT